MLRVLLAEPHRDTADSGALMLRCWGHDVQAVATGPAALQLAPAYRPQVALVELGLPGMDGFELARRLRQINGLEALPLVALTCLGTEPVRRRARAEGFLRHLLKPADPEVLRELLAQLTDGTTLSDAPPPRRDTQAAPESPLSFLVRRTRTPALVSLV